MSELNPRDPRPPYIQIAAALKAAMDSGELPPGERLPTIRQLEKDYGVAQQTVQHAFKLLRQEGRIVSWQGRGTFVVEPNSQPDHGDDDYRQILDQLTALEDNQHRIEQRMSELEATVARLQDTN